jgi:protein-S-isoprenylcysteine O-methyltransferase Ste14
MGLGRRQKEARGDRKDLCGEHAAGDAGQIILAIAFAIVWILDTFLLNYTTFLNDHVPNVARVPPALLILFLAGYLSKKGLSIVFDEEREEPCVIRKGVFGIVRHPVYLGEILLYLGLLLLSISLAAAVVWVIGVGFLHYISRYEEKLLLDRFGAEYEQYMREVPMWIPRLGRR